MRQHEIITRRTCDYCYTPFEGARRSTHCSPECYLIGMSRVEPTKGCRLWLGLQGGHGYGEVQIKGTRYTTHRLAYETFLGTIPDGMYVCHKCDVKLCVATDHLFLGTVLENTQDCVRKGRNCRKLTEEEVAYIRATPRYRGYGHRLAEELGVTAAQIYKVHHGHAWKYLLE